MQDVCPSSPVSPCCPRVWCVAGLMSATHFVLLAAVVGMALLNATVG